MSKELDKITKGFIDYAEIKAAQYALQADNLKLKDDKFMILVEQLTTEIEAQKEDMKTLSKQGLTLANIEAEGFLRGLYFVKSMVDEVNGYE